MSQAALDKIKELNRSYHTLTGRDAYEYASSPNPTTTRYVFATSSRVFTSTGDALTHMTEVLEKAQSGWTHDEIVYGKGNGSVLNPYSESRPVNRGAW